MFYLVQHEADEPFSANRVAVMSSHPTAAEAFAAEESRRLILPQLGLPPDKVKLVVVGENGSIVSRHPPGGDARSPCAPTMLWRLLAHDGTRVRAMLVPNARTCTLVWWFNDRQPFARELSNSDEAMAFADDLRRGFRARDFVDVEDHP